MSEPDLSTIRRRIADDRYTLTVISPDSEAQDRALLEKDSR